MHGMNNIKFTQGIHCCFMTVTKTEMFHEETASDFMHTCSKVFPFVAVEWQAAKLIHTFLHIFIDNVSKYFLLLTLLIGTNTMFVEEW